MTKRFLGWLAAAIAVAACITALAVPARAAIVTESVVYDIAGDPYEGYWAINEGFGDSQPLVILIHDWNGIGDYEQRRAQMLAEQGYAAFAIDLYGQGVRPTTVDGSREQSSRLSADRVTLRQRLSAGIAQAQMMPGVNADEIAAIGYCFGGSAVLELARSGADLDGFVSFHGTLATPEGQDYAQVQGPVLVLHGSDDPVAPMEQVSAMAKDMDAAGIDYTVEIYGGVDHAFTVWDSGERYDAEADVMSWQAMLEFFKTIF